jgi:hypothetical protein
MSAVLHSGLHDATATDAKGRNTRHRAGDNPAGCRLAKLIANLGIRRPTPHYSYSDYAGGSPRHCPLCAAGRDSGSRWAGVAARSRPGRSCRSGCAHWREDLFQPIAPSISEIMPELRDRSRTSSVNQDRTGENQPTEPICLGCGKPGFLTHEDKVTRKTDSLLEGPGFELSVPRKRDRFLKFAHQMAARKAYAQQSSAITATTGSSIPRGLNREPATMRPDSAGIAPKNCWK